MQADANPKQSRATARINSRLDKNLATYLTIAIATGVGAFALTEPADAEIVYTATNTVLNHGGEIPVDFNNDGIADLIFSYPNPSYQGILLIRAGSEQIMNNRSPSSVLPWGVRIGPKAVFDGGDGVIINANFHSTCASFGYWINKKGFYLGVQFPIAGQTHYGWIRLSIGHMCGGLTAVMTGYAYETIPNKPIIAGKTSGPTVSNVGDPDQVLAPFHQQGSLGALALGANGLNIWRREEDAP